MQHPALKTLSALLALGVVGFLVVQASLAGCRSAANDKPPISANATPSGAGGGAGSGASGATSATGAGGAPNAANAPNVNASPNEDPTYLPATKAGPVFRPKQAATGDAK